MKLHYTSASPYVRKVVVTAIEAGVEAEIERLPATKHVWKGKSAIDIVRDNHLGKVPTLITR